MLEIQIGFHRSNTSLCSLLAQRRKTNLSQHILWREENMKPGSIWRRMKRSVSRCSHQTLKKLKCSSDGSAVCVGGISLLLLYLMCFFFVRGGHSQSAGTGPLNVSVWICVYTYIYWATIETRDGLIPAFSTAGWIPSYLTWGTNWACPVTTEPKQTNKNLGISVCKQGWTFDSISLIVKHQNLKRAAQLSASLYTEINFFNHDSSV